MKQYFILLFLIACCSDCNQHPNSQKGVVQKIGKPFFDFDEIDYFRIEISEMKLDSLIIKENISPKEQDFINIITGYYPRKLKDLDTSKFSLSGYKKIPIQKSLLPKIRYIFSEKDSAETITMSCIAIYRDILVFKKNKKITGLAKICFGCRQFYFLGEVGNASEFGTEQDYQNLASTLPK